MEKYYRCKNVHCENLFPVAAGEVSILITCPRCGKLASPNEKNMSRSKRISRKKK